MAGLRTFSEAIIFTILFGFLMMMFAISFLGDTNPNSDATGDTYGLLNSSARLNSSLADISEFSDKAQTTMSNSSASPIQYVFLIFEGAFQIPMMFLSAVGGGIVALGTTFYTLGGGGWGGAFQICISVLLAVLILRLVLYIISAIRTGSSER